MSVPSIIRPPSVSPMASTVEDRALGSQAPKLSHVRTSMTSTSSTALGSHYESSVQHIISRSLRREHARSAIPRKGIMLHCLSPKPPSAGAAGVEARPKPVTGLRSRPWPGSSFGDESEVGRGCFPFLPFPSRTRCEMQCKSGACAVHEELLGRVPTPPAGLACEVARVESQESPKHHTTQP